MSYDNILLDSIQYHLDYTTSVRSMLISKLMAYQWKGKQNLQCTPVSYAYGTVVLPALRLEDIHSRNEQFAVCLFS